MLSYELTDEQKEIRDWVHDFAEREIRPVAAHYDETDHRVSPDRAVLRA